MLCFKKNDDLIVFNGQGLEALGTIQAISKKSAQIRLQNFSNHQRLKPSLVLACAIPKKSKFETIIEKCTELGADEIIPLKTIRTEMSGSAENLKHKHERYQEVAINACKQSQRSFLPKIHPVMILDAMFAMITADDLSLIGSLHQNRKPLASLSLNQLRKTQRIYILIGPEGDFTDEEMHLALSKGSLPVSLGPQVLKVETAAMAAISFLMLSLRS